MTKFVHHPFMPVYNAESKMLILGTMPSPASRKNDFYYAHPQNRFWKVIAAVFNAPFPESKDDKIKLILKEKLALWDVLSSCEIKGAADDTIKSPQPNDFSSILHAAKINRILCTGKKALMLYTSLCEKQTGIKAEGLPSTSPANRRISLDELITVYRAALLA